MRLYWILDPRLSSLFLSAAQIAQFRNGWSRHWPHRRTSYVCSPYWPSSHGCLLPLTGPASRRPSSARTMSQQCQRYRYWYRACNIAFWGGRQNKRAVLCIAGAGRSIQSFWRDALGNWPCDPTWTLFTKKPRAITSVTLWIYYY